MSKWLVWLVIVGALLDVGVFSFQVTQYHQIQQNGRKSDCWSHVLDDALKHQTSHSYHAHLTKEAEVCARIEQ